MSARMLSIRELSMGVFDGPHATPELHRNGAAIFLGIPNIRPDGSLDLAAARWVAEKDLPKWNRRVTPQARDIVFTYEATLNRYALIPEGLSCTLGRRTALIRPNPQIVDYRYLYYYFYSAPWRAQIEANTLTGATVDRIPLTTFPNFTVLVPDLRSQKVIGEVLENYDNLIATNQRRIALLEQAVKLLYREWFVQLRFPGHESLPVKSGEPEGWRMVSIADQVCFLNRGIAPKYDDTARGWVINQKCIRDGRITMMPARRQSKDVKPDRLVRLGDVLINSTGAGTLGRVAQVWSPIEDCTVDTHVTIARPIDSDSSTYFGQALLSLMPLFSEMGKGATNQLELSRSDIGAIKIWQPPKRVCVEFKLMAKPMLEQAAQLSAVIQSLERARDLLLPKLMSGQFDVSEIVLPKANHVAA